MECVVCDSEFEGKPTKKTCSTKCRVKLSRLRSVTEDDPSVTNVTVKDVNVTPEPPSVTEPENYYKSAEFLQLKKDIREKSVKQLTEEGYWIPAWKLNGVEVSR